MPFADLSLPFVDLSMPFYTVFRSTATPAAWRACGARHITQRAEHLGFFVKMARITSGLLLNRHLISKWPESPRICFVERCPNHLGFVMSNGARITSDLFHQMVPEPPRMVPESPESLCQTVPESPQGATKEMINRCLTHLHAISLACHITQRAAHLGFVLSNMVPESPRGGGCRRRSDGTFAPELGSKQSGGAKKAYKGLCEQVTETPRNASETPLQRAALAAPRSVAALSRVRRRL